MAVCKFGFLWKSIQKRKVPWPFVIGIGWKYWDVGAVVILFVICDDTNCIWWIVSSMFEGGRISVMGFCVSARLGSPLGW